LSSATVKTGPTLFARLSSESLSAVNEKTFLVGNQTDLLHLNNLHASSTYKEGDSLIVEASTLTPRVHKCGLFCELVKSGTKKVRYRDFPIQAQPTWLEISRQRFRCKDHGKTIYEDLPDIDTAARLTVRFKEHLEKEAVARTFIDAARTNGVDENLVRRLFATYAKLQLSNYTVRMPRVLGMDEKYIAKIPRFVIGDVENRKLLDIRENRLSMNLDTYFEKMEGKDAVEIVCQDMYKGYLTLTKRHFRRAATVVDKFHVLALSNTAVEMVRRDLNKSLGNRERIKLKSRNKLFLARWDTCKAETRSQLEKFFSLYPLLGQAYWLKEQLYGVYDCENRAQAEQALTEWMGSIPPELVKPFTVVTTAVKNWRPYMLRYFEHPLTNAYTESLNGLVSEINRVGRGYSFETLRAKALLKYGDAKRLIDLYDFDLMSCQSDEEMEFLTTAVVSSGVDISTLTDALKQGTL